MATSSFISLAARVAVEPLSYVRHAGDVSDLAYPSQVAGVAVSRALPLVSQVEVSVKDHESRIFRGVAKGPESNRVLASQHAEPLARIEELLGDLRDHIDRLLCIAHPREVTEVFQG